MTTTNEKNWWDAPQYATKQQKPFFPNGVYFTAGKKYTGLSKVAKHKPASNKLKEFN